MKLYLTLEADNGLKVERVIKVNHETPYNIESIVSDMVDSIETVEEANRLIGNDKKD